MRNAVIIFLVVWLSFPLIGRAQEERVETVEEPEISILSDTIIVEAPDSMTQAVLTVADAEFPKDIKLKTFKPDPNKALLYGLVPGLGQIYNRKYWKLPLVYGAVVGCTYAISWNNRNYQDYLGAFKDIHAEPSKDKQSWLDFYPGQRPETEEEIKAAKNNTTFINSLKRQKDYFRRYRDLSIIISAGIYLISVLDAYVDAQLFDFDISPDLSMRVEPAVTPKTSYSSQSYGVNCSIKF